MIKNYKSKHYFEIYCQDILSDNAILLQILCNLKKIECKLKEVVFIFINCYVCEMFVILRNIL